MRLISCLPLAIIVTLCQFSITSSENILVVAFFASKSHKNVYDPLYKALADKGHKITFIHPIKSDYKHENIVEVTGISGDQVMEEEYPNPADRPNFFEMRQMGLRIRTPISPMIVPMLKRACKAYYEMPELNAILKRKFALVFLASHMNECTYGIMHKLNTSYIFVHPHALENYKMVSTGLRLPSSFVPTYSSGATTDHMTFFDRTYNFIMYEIIHALYDWHYVPKMQEVYREHVGADAPSIREIEQNASLVLNNAHFSLTYPRPNLPQVIDIAGMHCRSGQPLPKDLQAFLDGSGSDGFILFSLGSHVKAKEMPENILKELIKGFSKLKQKVLWKWDTDSIEGVSNNVKVVSWVPQQDVLAHPKIRAFITHGGLLSTQEAAYHGIPLIGIPIFGDQYDWNLKQAESNGYAITLELGDITANRIQETVEKIINDPKYSSSAKFLGQVFRDRPVKALETAIYWTEYVMRHRGATHLRSSAIHLNILQYHSLDILAFLLSVTFIFFYTFWKLLKLLGSCCFSSMNTKVVKKISGKSVGKKKNQ